jgi:type IV pilus assembly protein PilQ
MLFSIKEPRLKTNLINPESLNTSKNHFILLNVKLYVKNINNDLICKLKSNIGPFKKIILIICLQSFISQAVNCQDKYLQIQEKLMILATGDIPSLNEKVNISVTNVSIQEFLRGVANNTGLNINVAPDLKIDVINNFSNVKVIDILMFLCRQYDLNISVIGNIINIFKEKTDIPAPVKKQLVKFDPESGLLSIECDGEDLGTFAKAVVDKTGLNVVTAPGLDLIKVKGYIQNLPIDNSLDKFAYANNLKVRKTDDNVYIFEKNEPLSVVPNTSQQQNSNQKQQNNNGSSKFKVSFIYGDSISISAENTLISNIIKEAADLVHSDYFFTSPVQGESTLQIKGISFPSLLNYLFRNTTYSYQKKDGVYLIGDNKSRELKEFRIIQLQNRTIDTLLSIIPSELKKELELKEFPELNSLLVSGMPDRINTLESAIRALDKVVPNILIEVMIIDVKNSSSLMTGLEAGVGKKPKTASTVFPSVDFNVSSQSINNLINSFNGFGTVKIGNVTPDFYLNLKALETNGIINIRSTPKLSTLNGHSASLSIGNTEYYKEEQSNIYGSITSQSQIVTTYKDVKAELSVKIRPVVSGDDQITLDIEVTQEDFTSRISQFSPPGKVARTFKSLIRVKNQDMILLGGLEEKRNSDTGSGVPFLSRVPVLKWLFSSRNKGLADAKLNIFIKPSIVE